MSQPLSVIVGVGDGLSASLARKLAHRGHDLVLASRRPDSITALAGEIKGRTRCLRCLAGGGRREAILQPERAPDVVVYNPSFRTRGPFVDLVASDVHKALEVCAFGGFLVGQAAARAMLQDKKGGTIVFTGASASVKGYAQSAPFAMGKFALRGLAQSMARELQPRGVHVAHVVIDGGIRSARRTDDGNDSLLDPDAIADSYLHLIDQPRTSWSWEIEVRPWLERF